MCQVDIKLANTDSLMLKSRKKVRQGCLVLVIAPPLMQMRNRVPPITAVSYANEDSHKPSGRVPVESGPSALPWVGKAAQTPSVHGGSRWQVWSRLSETVMAGMCL